MTTDIEPIVGYPNTYGLLLASLQDGTSEWRGELWGVELSPNDMTWRPRGGGQSMGAIFLHIMIVELFWFEEFALDRQVDKSLKARLQWDEIDVDNGIWPDPPRESFKWYCQMHDEIRLRAFDSIKQWPSPEATKPHHGRDISMRWVLSHVVQHEAYHGGQIILLNDLKTKTA